MPNARRHRFHGVVDRFEVLADYVDEHYGKSVRYIADVAGGQGMLARVLRKKYNYDCEVVDPRGWTLRGVPGRKAEFDPAQAAYYDLIIGLHPDEATRAVAQAALVRPAILIPCCNFWSEDKLGRDELVQAIAAYYREHGVRYEIVTFAFQGPKNVGLVSEPPSACYTSPAGPLWKSADSPAHIGLHKPENILPMLAASEFRDLRPTRSADEHGGFACVVGVR